MNHTKSKPKVRKRPRPYVPHLPNPWKILLAKDYPGVPFEQALVLYRRHLEKIVRQGMARQAQSRARRKANTSRKMPSP